MKSTFHPLKKEDSSSEKTEFLEERWPKSTGSCGFFVDWFHWNDIHQNATGMMINDDYVILWYIMSLSKNDVNSMRIHFYVPLIDLNTALFNQRKAPAPFTSSPCMRSKVSSESRTFSKPGAAMGHGSFLTQGTPGGPSRSAASPHRNDGSQHVTSFHAKILGIDMPNFWHSKPDIASYDTPSRTIWGVSYLRSLVISSVACLKIPSFDDCPSELHLHWVGIRPSRGTVPFNFPHQRDLLQVHSHLGSYAG